ncbi:MAG: AraC family transcriptional regulator [Oscillospiraceae bacterium]|nr:AraC family transcriptional regulator [Oscillospiraceae bacterium]
MAEKNGDIYQKIAFAEDGLRLLVHEGRVSWVDNNARTSQVFHEALEIKLFYEGGSTLVVDTDTIVAGEGDIIVINPYEFHSTVKLDEKKGKYHLFMIGLDVFTAANPQGLDLRHLLIARGLRFVNLIRGDAQLTALLQAILEENRRPDEFRRYAQEALLQQLFVHLLRHHLAPERSANVSDENIRFYEIIDPAIRRIHASYNQHISLDELAAECSVSKHHFCRVFKRAVGMTAVQYITNYRLRLAHILLTGTSKSIASIAWQCGFSDERYFCRCYKNQYGVSPWQNRAISSTK